MFRRILASGFVPFTQEQAENAKKRFSMAQEKMYAGNPMVKKDEEESEAKTVQMPYMSMPQMPKMSKVPQTPYAYAQNMAKAPNANTPIYAGAPMTKSDTE